MGDPSILEWDEFNKKDKTGRDKKQNVKREEIKTRCYNKNWLLLEN